MRPGAVVFDLFGTLLDITSLASIAATFVGEANAEPVVTRWRDKQIAYAFASSLMQRYDDFDALTSRALDYALASLGIALALDARMRLCDGWLELRPYPDAVVALEALRSRGVRTAVLTNGTLGTAKRALANSGLDRYLDDVWSVDEVGVYKPAPDVYRIATTRTGLQPAAIAFVSSNGWDATGAAAFGFRVIWCNRRALPAETLAPPPAHVVTSLDSLATLLA
jgi:2-haloacid dehalogenase